MGKYLNVGLTGGIACGKTLVRSVFQALGCHTLDADKIYHSLIEPGKPLYKKLKKKFGEGIIADAGTIDRKALGKLVFNDESLRQDLNKLVHPAVISEQKRLRKEIIKGLKKQQIDQGIIITDAALMIESGSYKEYDTLVVVASTPELQIQRLMEHRGLSREEATARLASQMPIDKKATYADHLIENTGTVKELIRRVEEVHATLAALCI